MRVTYGIEIKETNDIYIDAAEKAMNTMIETAVPGAFLVDLIPWLKYIPEWFPGAGFQKKAREWRKLQEEVHGLAFTAMAPLSWFTPIEQGGFSFPERYIAAGLALCGACQSLFMLVVFPPLHRRFGTGAILRTCALLWPFLFAFFPIFNQFRRNGWETAFWVITPILQGLGSGLAMAFSEFSPW